MRRRVAELVDRERERAARVALSRECATRPRRPHSRAVDWFFEKPEGSAGRYARARDAPSFAVPSERPNGSMSGTP